MAKLERGSFSLRNSPPCQEGSCYEKEKTRGQKPAGVKCADGHVICLMREMSAKSASATKMAIPTRNHLASLSLDMGLS